MVRSAKLPLILSAIEFRFSGVSSGLDGPSAPEMLGIQMNSLHVKVSMLLLMWLRLWAGFLAMYRRRSSAGTEGTGQDNGQHEPYFGLLELFWGVTKINQAQAIACLAAKWHICATIDTFESSESESPRTRIPYPRAPFLYSHAYFQNGFHKNLILIGF